MTSDMEIYNHVSTFHLKKLFQRGQRRQSEASCMDFSLGYINGKKDGLEEIVFRPYV